MKVTIDSDRDAVHVRLSRRNIRTLLAMLDGPSPERSILRRDGSTFLSVEAEEDDVHYADREDKTPHPSISAILSPRATP